VVVVSPRTGAPAVRRALPEWARLEICPNYRDDYLGQQVSKLYADELTDADLISHVDSDVVFVRPTIPNDLLDAGRPRIIRRDVGRLGRHRPWLASTERFLGLPVAYDFMQQPPFTYPRWLYPRVRAHCLTRHGMSLERYVTNRPPRGFSEFNVLGAYAEAYHPTAFAWREASMYQEPPFCRWYWSREGLDVARRRELDGLLAGVGDHERTAVGSLEGWPLTLGER
jgi:hypothetical protein